MNDNEDDLDNLECLDLNDIINEKNKCKTTVEKNNNTDLLNIEEENLYLKLTKSINKDINNYIKESEEANLILTNNFTLVNKSTTKNKSNNNK